ncbi:dinucleotide-utilizing enzyme possibly involved in molybdopterin or thiamin biosynthesis [Burkholderia sp. Ch1-1]|uniref:Molybdopterin-synthase adenylyltransferase n=2 Tax=Burkholderiaceae TaxID=119060 RepID=A0A5Q4Z1X3_9BURK|nr:MULTISPECIES: molybdopterin-synthase adenylyltransferase MoeB [Paraburkholderia]EIF31673.1 dinucleotide-utilizing enzyme possibly involved in molybdopterin or thiamin biosynthesis [Burkholderia sp. Ch1-1]MDR8398007.1 molybdopterin-synthase adenylyltransferase MoeB [Paraburkholderia sp. USG1]VVD28044.1 Sulfur carrier protein CysO adenylyltransferase / Sulfur carrier protein CysO sulfurtransferase [Paraburkholderia dioscoreae]
MKVVIFPEVLARAARLPSHRMEAEGRTVREVIEHVCARHSPLRVHLFYENDAFKEHFLLTSSGEVVDPEHAVPAGGEVEIMLATSGGLDTDHLSNDEIRRYVRHITLPGVGRAGQLRLKKAKVLIIGTGGLGSPICLYLAAAGVGTLGLIDFDVVERSNLQRQIVHGNSTLGMLKVESAKQRLHDLNADIEIDTYAAALDADNARHLIGQYDVIVDGTDNFASRYLVNDVCAQLGKPLVYGAIYRFEGQMSVFNYRGGPCYRCLFPNSPPPELAPNCTAGGVIGVLPGVVGLIQATEAIKLILDIGESLAGRLMRFDALTMRFNEVRFSRRSGCPSCSPNRHGKLCEPAQIVCSSVNTDRQPLAPDFFIEPYALKAIMERADSNPILLDVRDANELEVCRLPGVLHIPLDELSERTALLDSRETYYLICYGGLRAERAAIILQDVGFPHVKVLEGGMKRWVRDVEPDMPIY